MISVVQVPGLMTNAMRFGKYLSEEIPVLLSKKVLGDCHLAIDTTQKTVPELGQLGSRSVGIAQATLRMLSKVGDDFLR